MTKATSLPFILRNCSLGSGAFICALLTVMSTKEPLTNQFHTFPSLDFSLPPSVLSTLSNPHLQSVCAVNR